MMNPKLLKSIFSCLIITVSTSVLMAQEVERSENILNFNGVSVSSGIDLYLSQSNTEKIVVKGTKELMDRLKVSKSDDGTLKLELESINSWGSWTFGNSDYVKAYVSFKTLNKLIASGGSDVFSQGQLHLSNLALRSSGGSDIKLDLIVDDLKVMTSGGSDVYLKGKANIFTLQASGGSDVSAYNLIADEVTAQTSGGSDAQLYASKSIKIAASGASDVNYKGTATRRTVSSSGASDVTKVN